MSQKFWDAEGKRRSRNPYEKSTLRWSDERATRQFLLDYVLRHQPEGWRRALVHLKLIAPDQPRNPAD